MLMFKRSADVKRYSESSPLRQMWRWVLKVSWRLILLASCQIFQHIWMQILMGIEYFTKWIKAHLVQSSITTNSNHSMGSLANSLAIQLKLKLLTSCFVSKFNSKDHEAYLPRYVNSMTRTWSQRFAYLLTPQRNFQLICQSRKTNNSMQIKIPTTYSRISKSPPHKHITNHGLTFSFTYYMLYQQA